MEVLREILLVVTSKGDKAHLLQELDSVNGDSEASDSLTARFIRGIYDDSWPDDETAAQALYGSDTGDQRYRTLKSRVFERLLHSLLFLQVKQPEHSEYLAYYYKCTRNLLCAQTLTRFAARNAGYSIATKTLTIAQKYQFTDLCLSLSAMLAETSAFWMKKKDFKYYSSLVDKYLGNLAAEYKSSQYLDQLGLESDNSSRKRGHLATYALGLLDTIETLITQHDTHLLRLNAYRFKLVYLQLIEDYDGTINNCDAAIKYLTEHPHLSQKARLGEFILNKMLCCTYLRRYSEAHAMSDICITYFKIGGSNWYLAIDLAFVTASNLCDFDKALGYYVKATTHEQFTKHREASVRERWLLYYAYLLLAKRMVLIDSDLIQSKHFRLATYLNSLPEESKSKLAFNVLILISHVYFLILDGNYDAAEKRVEYLKVYTSRWLKEKEYLRVRLFLKMLYNFSRFSFDAKAIRNGNKELYRELQDSGKDPMPSETNELIPFEVMYERILDHLEKHPAGLLVK